MIYGFLDKRGSMWAVVGDLMLGHDNSPVFAKISDEYSEILPVSDVCHHSTKKETYSYHIVEV